MCEHMPKWQYFKYRKNKAFINNKGKDIKTSMDIISQNKHELKQKVISHIVAIKHILTSQKQFLISSYEDRRKENIRKTFHLVGLIIPFLILFLPQKTALVILISILIPLLIADYHNFSLLFKHMPHTEIILQLFREHELIKGKLTGLSWLFIGILISIISFDKHLVALSVAVLIVGDAAAALIGKNFGKVKICGSKTLEGTIAFVIASSITSLVFIEYVVETKILSQYPSSHFEFNSLFVCISAVMASIVELISKEIEIDDNLSVPIAFCSTYQILTILL